MSLKLPPLKPGSEVLNPVMFVGEYYQQDPGISVFRGMTSVSAPVKGPSAAPLLLFMVSMYCAVFLSFASLPCWPSG